VGGGGSLTLVLLPHGVTAKAWTEVGFLDGGSPWADRRQETARREIDMSGQRLFYTTMGLALAFALGGALSAQEGEGRRGGGRGGRGGFGFGGGFGTINKPALLASSQVRTELKIKEEQGKKIDEVLAAYRESSRDFRRGGGPDASDEERKKAREENAKKSAELVKTTEGKLAAILDKDQQKRLDEIAIQQQGTDALASESVVAALSLKGEQVEKIKAEFAKRDEEMAKLRPAGGRRGGDGGGAPNFQELREKMDKVRKDTETAVLAVLTKEQSEAFAKLKGAPFELDRSTLFQGGGGRGGRGEGGRGGEGGKKSRPPDDEI
jgi:hypothetical protein